MSNKYIVTRFIENSVMLLQELKGRKNCVLIIKRYKSFELNNVILEQIKSRNIKLFFEKE